MKNLKKNETDMGPLLDSRAAIHDCVDLQQNTYTK
jgi:hypothetical protein